MNLHAVIKVLELDDGSKKYQPCLLRYAENTAPNAGELLVPEVVWFDTLEEANKKAEEMVNELFEIMQTIAEGLPREKP